MKKVLMVCTGNTCRSVMAQALLEKLAKEAGIEVEVESAGLGAFAGDPATPQAIEVMREYGLDISEHRSRLLWPERVAEADVIFTMTEDQKRALVRMMPEAADKCFVLKEAAYSQQENGGFSEKRNKDISDPFGQSVERYRSTAQEIQDALNNIVQQWHSSEEK